MPSLRSSQNEACQEPAFRSGREAPSSFGRRRRRAPRRSRRSVSIAPPKAGRGTECDRPELSVSGACAAPQNGSSPERAETRAELVANLWRERAAPGTPRLEPGPKGTHENVYRSKNTVLIFDLERRALRSMKMGNTRSPWRYDVA